MKRWHWASCISPLPYRLCCSPTPGPDGLLILEVVVPWVNASHQPAQHTAVTDSTPKQLSALI